MFLRTLSLRLTAALFFVGSLYPACTYAQEKEVCFDTCAYEDIIRENLQRGHVYEYGWHETKQDYVEAMRWYLKAAENGSSIAHAKIGMMYKYGEGVPQDEVKAAEWIKKSKEVRKAWALAHPGVREPGLGLSYKPPVLPVPAEKNSPDNCGKWIDNKAVSCLLSYEVFPKELDIPRVPIMYRPLFDGVRQIVLIFELPDDYERISDFPTQWQPDNLARIISKGIYESQAAHNLELDNGHMPPIIALARQPKEKELGSPWYFRHQA
jgi:hypothetical protein